MGSTSRTWRRSLLAAASAVSLMVVVAPMPAQAGDSKGDDKGKGVMDSKELRKAVKANGVMKHLEELRRSRTVTVAPGPRAPLVTTGPLSTPRRNSARPATR